MVSLLKHNFQITTHVAAVTLDANMCSAAAWTAVARAIAYMEIRLNGTNKTFAHGKQSFFENLTIGICI